MRCLEDERERNVHRTARWGRESPAGDQRLDAARDLCVAERVLLDVDAEGYGGLRLTEASRGVLKGDTQVMLRKPTNTKERTRTTRAATGADIDLAPADRPLFESLRALRGRLAREQNVPAYVIFHDATLREIARLRPISHGQLGGIGGVGAGKLERYGDAVLETVLDAD